MFFDKIKKHFKDGVKISGANLGDVEKAEFSMLSDAKHEVEYTKEEIDIVKRFESKLIELYERVENGSKEETSISPMEIQEGKVVLKEGQIRHRCAPTMETLSGISVGGVLASEWFGKRESELEGFMCAFVSKRIKLENPIFDRKNANISSPTSCVLFFDEHNPLMQALLNIDFFEYQNIKINHPEKLEEIYPPRIIELYDKIIAPKSPASKHFHDSSAKFTYPWIAIPGGIPPQLINGICINSAQEELITKLDEISKMYPNATIFDEKQNVLAQPKKNTFQNEDEPH